MAGENSNNLKPTDPGSPFYLGGSDNPGVLLTIVQLRGEANYDNWAKLMKNALSAKNKLGFITGDVKKPEKDNAADWRAWVMCNSMINGWIHNTIDPTLQPFIKCFEEVKDLWEDLKERYAVQNFPRQYQLKASLTTIRQHGSTVGEYYTKLRAVWDDLEGNKTRKSCACGDDCAYAKEAEEEREHDRVYQFHMGLDDTLFGNLRSQILNTTPLPTLNKAYATVTQEKTHRTIARSHDARNTAVSYATRTDTTKEMAAQPMLPEKPPDRSPCPHCGKNNHDPSRCWSKYGYPPNRGSARGRGCGRGRSDYSHGGRFASDHVPTANAAQISPIQQAAPPVVSQQVNAFSTLTPELITKLVALVEGEKLTGKAINLPWLIDSGASQHMTGSINLLIDVVPVERLAVNLPNGSITYAEHQGTIVLSQHLKLTNVLYVPQLCCNLISVSQLLQQGVYSRVYVFQPQSFSVAATHTSDSLEVWHKRLGHPSYEVVSLISPLSHFQNKAVHDKACDVCFRAKHTRSVFPFSFARNKESFDLVHCDT
ncbi:uncharacterized protein LOC133291594 [Gastrolobium bilobum]|uniref:uncharacterized protein LOC133291594 n=1 Tax=Gastrolobium bilobum TaxID=150636 RepID=UPI002AAF214C|nr:uncharacterized protein LOC133291594 [Gastrolobium bilobum]